ncbi:hypothetical protein NHX12_034088 [Muraenolepis orangiensis]|uniref:Ig-like domain-containing protein n=1 Tax=Muraenolepis orangiensis TaxID=630683 RepID=A0A9Q0E6U8_9TELE|nr:hypothetical protein NHX12_034088 [Muraenolepis orangiensis]
MEYHWILFSVVLQLTFHPGRPRLTIAPAGAHLVVPLNGALSLHCTGQRVVQWQREAGPRIRVQVRNPDNAFRKSMVFNLLTRSGDSASIPCLATDPGLVDLRLETCHGGPLASGLRYTASLEKGVTIHDTEKADEGCYVCTGRLGVHRVQSLPYQLTVRPVPVAPPEIQLQGPKRVLLTQGQSLSLGCNTSNANGDIKIKWIPPPGSVSSLSLASASGSVSSLSLASASGSVSSLSLASASDSVSSLSLASASGSVSSLSLASASGSVSSLSL